MAGLGTQNQWMLHFVLAVGMFACGFPTDARPLDPEAFVHVQRSLSQTDREQILAAAKQIQDSPSFEGALALIGRIEQEIECDGRKMDLELVRSLLAILKEFASREVNSALKELRLDLSDRLESEVTSRERQALLEHFDRVDQAILKVEAKLPRLNTEESREVTAPTSFTRRVVAGVGSSVGMLVPGRHWLLERWRGRGSGAASEPTQAIVSDTLKTRARKLKPFEKYFGLLPTDDAESLLQNGAGGVYRRSLELLTMPNFAPDQLQPEDQIVNDAVGVFSERFPPVALLSIEQPGSTFVESMVQQISNLFIYRFLSGTDVKPQVLVRVDGNHRAFVGHLFALLDSAEKRGSRFIVWMDLDRVVSMDSTLDNVRGFLRSTNRGELRFLFTASTQVAAQLMNDKRLGPGTRLITQTRPDETAIHDLVSNHWGPGWHQQYGIRSVASGALERAKAHATQIPRGFTDAIQHILSNAMALRLSIQGRPSDGAEAILSEHDVIRWIQSTQQESSTTVPALIPEPQQNYLHDLAVVHQVMGHWLTYSLLHRRPLGGELLFEDLNHEIAKFWPWRESMLTDRHRTLTQHLRRAVILASGARALRVLRRVSDENPTSRHEQEQVMELLQNLAEKGLLDSVDGSGPPEVSQSFLQFLSQSVKFAADWLIQRWAEDSVLQGLVTQARSVSTFSPEQLRESYSHLEKKESYDPQSLLLMSMAAGMQKTLKLSEPSLQSRYRIWALDIIEQIQADRGEAIDSLGGTQNAFHHLAAIEGIRNLGDEACSLWLTKGQH